jgi:hypothetical protein
MNASPFFEHPMAIEVFGGILNEMQGFLASLGMTAGDFYL